jgi:hypothetical protein
VRARTRALVALGFRERREERELGRGGFTRGEELVELTLEHLGDVGLAAEPVALEVAVDRLDAVVRHEAEHDRGEEEHERGGAGPLPARCGQGGADERPRRGEEPPRDGVRRPDGEQQQAEPREQRNAPAG